MSESAAAIPDSNVRFLRLPAVMSRVGLSRSGIYAKIATGDFPVPTKISRRCVVWTNFSIDSWINSHIKAAGEN